MSNSAANPAPAGSIVSVFGSGLGPLAPPLTTGGLASLSPLSTTQLTAGCYQCEVVYIGSAPGLCTAVFQANLRLAPFASQSETGVRPMKIGLGVSFPPRPPLFVSSDAIVYIK